MVFAETLLFVHMVAISVAHALAAPADSFGLMRKLERKVSAMFALQPAMELETAEIVRSSSLQLVIEFHES